MSQTTVENRRMSFLREEFATACDLYLEKSNLLRGKDPFELVRAESTKEVLEWNRISNQLILLLEFLYMRGTILINKSCSWIVEQKARRPIQHMSYRAFLMDYDADCGLSKNLKQRLYCFVTYRNKLIEHHDKFRVGTSFFSGENARIVPMGKPFFDTESIDQKDEKYNKPEMIRLAKKYHYSGDQGMNSILTKLFYSIPYSERSDRKSIDDLVEEWGCCESQSFRDINELFRDFFVELDTLH